MPTQPASRPETRQALYDQIRETSRDEVILREMIRLGFWNKDKESKVPEELIKRKAELGARMRELSKKQSLYMDRDKALAEIHKIRKEESKKRRLELKEEREKKERERKKQWKETKEKQILFLGDRYSHSLGKLDSTHEKLNRYGLEDYASHKELAEKMGISLRELKFLTFTRDVTEVSHYRRFTVPKKTGGKRTISAPQDRLKSQQYWVYENILKKLPLHAAAHGFREEKSILTNSAPHVKAGVVINIDLKDFFPSLSYQRVLGAFTGLGYSPAIATVLALLTTEQPYREVELDGKRWFVNDGERGLPQGAPTSPAITNWVCRRLDARLKGVSDKHGFSYTRYADDMTFSLPKEQEGESQKLVSQLLWHVKKIVSEEGFTIHPDKLRVMRSGARKEVTGIVVNEKPSICRNKVRRFRALLHHLKTKGMEGASWDGSSERLLARSLGYSRFLVMVDAERFTGMQQELSAFAERQGFQPEIRHPRKPDSEKAQACEDLTEEEIAEIIKEEMPVAKERNKQPLKPPPPRRPSIPTSAPQPSNSLATVALICAILAVFIGITAPVALILGIMSLKNIKYSQGTLAGTKRSWAGILVGGLYVILFIWSVLSLIFRYMV